MLVPTASHVSTEEWQERLLALHASTTSQQLIDAVFQLLQATVTCDFSMVVLHAVDNLPMVAQDSLGRVYSYEFMEQSYRHNPATIYLMQHPGVPMLTTREQLPQGDAIFDHPFYEHGMKPMGFRHCLALFFWDFVPLIAHQVFAVFREEGRADFNTDEEQAMLALHPHINVALKRVRAQERDHAQLASLHKPSVQPTHGEVLLDWDLAIKHASPLGHAALLRWSGASDHLPPPILKACVLLKQQWRALLQMDPKGSLAKHELVEHPTEEGLRASVSLVQPMDAVLTQPSFHVRLEISPTTQDEVQLRLATLTDAERQVAILVAACLDNQQIADRLRIRVSAVKTRLHSAFKKLQIQSRSHLVRLLRLNE